MCIGKRRIVTKQKVTFATTVIASHEKKRAMNNYYEQTKMEFVVILWLKCIYWNDFLEKYPLRKSNTIDSLTKILAMRGHSIEYANQHVCYSAFDFSGRIKTKHFEIDRKIKILE